MVPTGIHAIGLFVDANDDQIAAVVQRVPLDVLQLHGDEPPRRVAEIRARFGIPVMKAIRVATAEDLAPLPAYESIADQILFDAKVPKSIRALPGGTGLPFDWQLLSGMRIAKPWMLSGGLTAENLAEAVAITGARMVDVSSGVEDRPGVKSVEKIAAFLTAAKAI